MDEEMDNDCFFAQLDNVAMTGIFDDLPPQDKVLVRQKFEDRGGENFLIGTKERRYVAYRALVELGFIMVPPQASSSDLGAEEYDEIIAMQDLVEGV